MRNRYFLNDKLSKSVENVGFRSKKNIYEKSLIYDF